MPTGRAGGKWRDELEGTGGPGRFLTEVKRSEASHEGEK
jgi:hypothetical protein